MIEVTIMDVIKEERRDPQGRASNFSIIILQDKDRKKFMPIWIGPFEGQSIAVELKNHPVPRPLTFYFMASLLKAIDAGVEEVRIDSIKNDIYYGIVKITCGGVTKEVDARPSDAMALALLTHSPILVADEVFKAAAIDVPPGTEKNVDYEGAANILKDLPAFQPRPPQAKPLSKAEIEKTREDLIAALFTK